jgi:hypothetical protein
MRPAWEYADIFFEPLPATEGFMVAMTSRMSLAGAAPHASWPWSRRKNQVPV